MSKHTPGPWIPDFGEAYRVRAQLDGGQVAVMTNLKGQFGLAGRRDGNEVAANAALIAAAPDLLAALERLSAQCERLRMPGQPMSDAEKTAIAAIAKATGGQS